MPSRDAAPSQSATPQTPSAAKSHRLRLLLALALALFGLALLGYRFYAIYGRPPRPERLRLGDNVPLSPPPPLKGDDRLAVQSRLRGLEPLLMTARLHPQDPQAHLNFAREAMRAGDLLSAQAALQMALRLNPQAG